MLDRQAPNVEVVTNRGNNIILQVISSGKPFQER